MRLGTLLCFCGGMVFGIAVADELPTGWAIAGVALGWVGRGITEAST
jgi:hypothetical protein